MRDMALLASQGKVRGKRIGYKHLVLDPASALLCAVLYRAVRDWKLTRRNVRMHGSQWPLAEWREQEIDDLQSELLSFFRSPDFRGICDWLDLDADKVLHTLRVPHAYN